MGLSGDIEQALERLLHDAPLRARWLQGEEVFALAPDDRAALRAIDPVELEATAASVRAAVWRTAHGGSGTLADRFPLTIAAWRRAHGPDPEGEAMMDAFLASGAFAAHREVPAGTPGTSLEEAFFAWCERANVGDEAEREEEFLAAMARALAVCPTPSFTVPGRFRRCPGGWFALSSAAAPVLHAAAGGRVLRGPVTPLVAALLTSADEPTALAREHGVDADSLAPIVAQLTRLGLA